MPTSLLITTSELERHINTSATLSFKCAQAHMKLEICTSGSVGGRGGNTPTYPARTKPLRVALRAILDRFCARRPLIPCGSGRGNGLPRSNKETDAEKYR